MGPFIQTGLILVFNLLHLAFLMIFQFVMLFWFIGRPRIYWLMPGETGVGFKDYKGNPKVLESARQVVTLLKGVKRFKQMGDPSTSSNSCGGIACRLPIRRFRSRLECHEAGRCEQVAELGALVSPSNTKALTGC